MDQKLKIEKTVRYYTFGNFETAKNIWIVLHGYGQLPYYFIRKFQSLNPEDHFIIAPEGLHRFYLNGTSGRVGASWMTKEARLDDISDNNKYLNALYQSFQDKKFDKKILLGFSQGGATAARWHEQGKFNADLFILWASVFPPDLDFNIEQSSLTNSTNYFVLGDDDPYYKDTDIAIENQIKSKKINFNRINFKGKHDISSDALNEIINSF